MAITYYRWRAGEERRTAVGRFEPLADDHPSVGHECPVCSEPLQAGQVPTVFAIGPETPENAAKHDAGQWYAAMAIVMHESCAWPGEST